jgi:hypothetical protein
METYIKLCALLWEHRHCKGIIAQSKLSLDAIRSMHADFYSLPDETRIGTLRSGDWDGGGDHHGKLMIFKLSTIHSILEGCLTATCNKWENGMAISSIDTGHASIAHEAKTLARPSGSDNLATQQANLGILTRSAARRGRSAARGAYPCQS